jgi:amino acid transporter
MVTLPLEIVAAAITIQYWNSPVSSAVWVTIFLVLIIAINLLGVKGYGEAEFWMALIKVIAIIGFMYFYPPSPLSSCQTNNNTASWG